MRRVLHELATLGFIAFLLVAPVAMVATSPGVSP